MTFDVKVVATRQSQRIAAVGLGIIGISVSFWLLGASIPLLWERLVFGAMFTASIALSALLLVLGLAGKDFDIKRRRLHRNTLGGAGSAFIGLVIGLIILILFIAAATNPAGFVQWIHSLGL